MKHMPEFVFHWMVLGEVYDDLGLERPHRDSAQQQPLPDGEYGCLFHARSLERPFSDGVHEDISRDNLDFTLLLKYQLLLLQWQK